MKYCLYKGGQEPEEVARGLIDRVGMADSQVVLESRGKPPLRRQQPIANHEKALNVILNVTHGDRREDVRLLVEALRDYADRHETGHPDRVAA